VRKKKTKTKAKRGYRVCADCGGQFKDGAPHQMFCPAKSCEDCGTTFSEVIEKDVDGRRICEGCQEV
jgi:hypothetical protein